MTAWARKVVAGQVVAGHLTRLACQRHLDDLKAGKDRGLVWDRAAALHAIEFFSHLRHSTGEWAGQPFDLQPWQQFVVGSVFGWKRADGLRRFRTAYVEVARKNGKSALLAGIALYALVADGEAGAHVYAAATTRDQARIVFGEAERMVAASQALSSRVTRTVNNLAVLPTASWFRPLSADASKMDGLNVHFAAVDEVHEHPGPEIIQKLNTATGARRQPLIFEITTAGHDRHSVCRQHHEFSVKALEGTLPEETADPWFAFIATIDAGDDWTDPKVWVKANPSLGVTVKLDDLKRQIDEAPGDPDRIADLAIHARKLAEQPFRLGHGAFDQAQGARRDDRGGRPDRGYGDRPDRGYGDRPDRRYGDRDRRNSTDSRADRREQSDFGSRGTDRWSSDRPARRFDDRPRPARNSFDSRGDRPDRADFGRNGTDRRSYERPARGERQPRDDRRTFGDARPSFRDDRERPDDDEGEDLLLGQAERELHLHLREPAPRPGRRAARGVRLRPAPLCESFSGPS